MLQSGKNQIHIFEFHRTLDILCISSLSSLLFSFINSMPS
ncbi:unnamed protein product [Tenebrio molitor]|nr:unnamed protein product [Tenebrio molitor]